jgi:hypothetical protein
VFTSLEGQGKRQNPTGTGAKKPMQSKRHVASLKLEKRPAVKYHYSGDCNPKSESTKPTTGNPYHNAHPTRITESHLNAGRAVSCHLPGLAIKATDRRDAIKILGLCPGLGKPA